MQRAAWPGAVTGWAIGTWVGVWEGHRAVAATLTADAGALLWGPAVDGVAGLLIGACLGLLVRVAARPFGRLVAVAALAGAGGWAVAGASASRSVARPVATSAASPAARDLVLLVAPRLPADAVLGGLSALGDAEVWVAPEVWPVAAAPDAAMRGLLTGRLADEAAASGPTLHEVLRWAGYETVALVPAGTAADAPAVDGAGRVRVLAAPPPWGLDRSAVRLALVRLAARQATAPPFDLVSGTAAAVAAARAAHRRPTFVLVQLPPVSLEGVDAIVAALDTGQERPVLALTALSGPPAADGTLGAAPAWIANAQGRLPAMRVGHGVSATSLAPTLLRAAPRLRLDLHDGDVLARPALADVVPDTLTAVWPVPPCAPRVAADGPPVVVRDAAGLVVRHQGYAWVAGAPARLYDEWTDPRHGRDLLTHDVSGCATPAPAARAEQLARLGSELLDDSRARSGRALPDEAPQLDLSDFPDPREAP